MTRIIVERIIILPADYKPPREVNIGCPLSFTEQIHAMKVAAVDALIPVTTVQCKKAKANTVI